MSQVSRLHHATYLVDDIQAARQFYCGELGLENIEKPGLDYPGLFLKINDHQQLHLAEMNDKVSFRGHCCLVVTDFYATFLRMRELKVLDLEAWGGMRELGNGMLQLYVRDPAGNLVEIVSDPADRARVDLEMFLAPEFHGGPYLHHPVGNDRELARRAVANFAEELFTCALRAFGPGAARHDRDLIGGTFVPDGALPYQRGLIVPAGLRVPQELPAEPPYVWTLEESVVGRREAEQHRMPVMGFWFRDRPARPGPELRSDLSFGTPSFVDLARVNEAVYDSAGQLEPALATLIDDPRMRTYGLREGQTWVCVCFTFDLGRDTGVHYVATLPRYRKQGLASLILERALNGARTRGQESATLQASPLGVGVYERLGFRWLGTLRCFVQ